MRTIDHLFLGKYLANRYMDCESEVNRRAFVIGNILPDINFMTYFRGFLSKGELRGHNYEQIKPVISKLFKSLGRRNKKYGLYDYLRLGKLMHYVADAFTYPHNECFKGTLKAHIDYEESLHTAFKEFGQDSFRYIYYIKGDTLMDKFLSLHDEFLNNADDLYWNVECIYTAANLTMDKLVVTWGEEIEYLEKQTI